MAPLWHGHPLWHGLPTRAIPPTEGLPAPATLRPSVEASARSGDLTPTCVVFDEFTSVVDRKVAQIGSAVARPRVANRRHPRPVRRGHLSLRHRPLAPARLDDRHGARGSLFGGDFDGRRSSSTSTAASLLSGPALRDITI